MRKALVLALAVVCCLAFAGNASAGFIAFNFDPDGAGTDYGLMGLKGYWGIQGTTYIENSFSSFPSSGTFEEWGSFVASNYGAGSWPGVGNSHQVTATVNGVTGNIAGNDLSFTGGTVQLFSDENYNYSSTDEFFGANDGDLIMTLNVDGGGGSLSELFPNGDLTINFSISYIAAGYFFDSNGVDLSTYDPHFLVAQVLVDAHLMGPEEFVGENFITEWNEWLLAQTGEGLDDPYSQHFPFEFFVANGGQFKIGVVPEPATLALLGSGLLGLAGFGFRRKRK